MLLQPDNAHCWERLSPSQRSILMLCCCTRTHHQSARVLRRLGLITPLQRVQISKGYWLVFTLTLRGEDVVRVAVEQGYTREKAVAFARQHWKMTPPNADQAKPPT